MRQTFLGDGKLWTCSGCSMQYHRGNLHDEEYHLKYHRKNFIGYRGPRYIGYDGLQQHSSPALLSKLWILISRDLSPTRILPDDLDPDHRVFGWVEKGRAVGLLWLVPQVTACRAVVNGRSVAGLDLNDRKLFSFGVELMWVLRMRRCNGIGLSMLQAACSEPLEIAFSQTTSDGLSLALRFLKDNDLFIYQ